MRSSLRNHPLHMVCMLNAINHVMMLFNIKYPISGLTACNLPSDHKNVTPKDTLMYSLLLDTSLLLLLLVDMSGFLYGTQ